MISPEYCILSGGTAEHRGLVRSGRAEAQRLRFEEVKALVAEGQPFAVVARRTGLDFRTVAKWSRFDTAPQRGGARCLAGRAETRSAITSRAAGPRDARCGGSCSQRSKRSDMPRASLPSPPTSAYDPRLLGDPGDRFRYLARGDMRRTRSMRSARLDCRRLLAPRVKLA